MLKKADFWIGALAAFLLLTFFPQLNFMTGAFGTKGRGA